MILIILNFRNFRRIVDKTMLIEILTKILGTIKLTCLEPGLCLSLLVM